MKIHSPIVTGSLSVSPSLTVTGTIEGTASLANTASLAQTASYVQLAQTASFVQLAQTASFVLQAVSASRSETSSLAFTASSADNFLVRQNATASNMLLTGTLVAQTINVQTVTSSIVYSSGSNRFGNQLTDVQQMTGSLRVTGSGDHWVIGGNVGIGAAPSAYKLDVNGTGRFGSSLTVKTTETPEGLIILGRSDDYSVMRFKTSGGTTKATIYTNPNNLVVDVGTAFSALTLDSSGNLGLGVTPSAWSIVTPIIQIGSGGAFIGGQGSANIIRTGVNLYYDGSNWRYINAGYGSWSETSDGAFKWFSVTSGLANAVASPSNLMTLDSSGRLGIGTPSPTATLQIGTGIGTFDGLAIGGAANRDIRIGQSSTNNLVLAWKYNATAASAYALIETFGGSNNLILQGTGGNVGIGTTSPLLRCHILGSTGAFPSTSGTTQTGGVLRLQNSDSNGILDIGGNGGSGFWLQTTNATTFAANYSLLLNPNGGNVGIGTTTPDYKLEVNGTTKVTGVLTQGSSQLTEYTSGVQTDPVQNTWYTVYTFAEFELTAFFLMVGFENNNGDGANLTAVFVDSGTTSYGGGFSTTRLTGSTTLEAQRGTGFTLQIRTTGTAGTSTKLRWNLIRIDGE